MAKKLVRESKFSGLVRNSLGGEYDVIRVETRIEDGWSDLLAIRRADGVACYLELKQIDHLTKTGYTRLALEPEQAIFLRDRVVACKEVGAAVLLRVGENMIYTFPAREEPQWPRWIRSQLYPDQLSSPLCFRHRISELRGVIAAQAYSARFTPAHLTPMQGA